MTYRIYTHTQRQPGHGITAGVHPSDAWDAYTEQDTVFLTHWDALLATFPDFTFYICDDADVILASASVAPLYFDAPYDQLPDGGWRWVVETALIQHQRGIQPNLLSALGINVVPAWRGQGLSQLALQTMREAARSIATGDLIAPVRPSQKHLYPLIPMQEYITWAQPAASDGDSPLLFDAWLRTHQRMGARIIRVAEESMRVVGTAADWHGWTGLHFPADGRYIVPGGLVPVHFIDGSGLYSEPNVWMLHR